MKDNHIPLIGLERFRQHPEHTIYMDDNLAVIDNLSEMMTTDEETVKLDCFLIAICQEGSLTVNINGQQHLLQKDYCALIPPHAILRHTNTPSDTYTIKIVAFSPSFLSETLTLNRQTWQTMHYLSQHPIHPVKPTDSYKIYLYKELLLTLVQETPHAYSLLTRRYHLAGLLCEMMATLQTLVPENYTSPHPSHYIVRKFLELVNADDGTHRSVGYYADCLCYTPKYISGIIKEATGKTPLQIINEHAIKQITHELQRTDKSIKEIADHFNFANPSFFGKFVKQHTGMTPGQFRMMKENTQESSES